MIIKPENGNIIVSQRNQTFGKVYTSTFPDTKDGMKKAFDFVELVVLGWLDCQDKDWEKHYVA